MGAAQNLPVVGANLPVSGPSGRGQGPAPAGNAAGFEGTRVPANTHVGASKPLPQATSTAIVPLGAVAAEGPDQNIDPEWMPFSPVVARLPVELDVVVPVRGFRVQNMLALEPGQLIESQWGHGDDVPLSAGEVELAWCEFEVIDSQLAVRITRLS